MISDKGSYFLKSLASFSIASWLQAAIAFISIPIITRAFTPEAYGKINMFNLAVTVISLLVGLSLEQSYVRYFKEKVSDSSRKKMLSQLIAITIIVFILYIFANLAFGKSLSQYLFGELNSLIIYIALPVMVLMTIISMYQKLYFRMSENAFGYSILSILVVVATKLILVLAALIRPTYSMGILLSVMGLVLLVAGYLIFSRKSFDIDLPELDIKQISQYLKYSLPLVPVAIIVFFNSSIVRFLLKDYISYEALGIFTASLTVVSLLSLVQSGFTVYWTPFMYANYKTESTLIKRIHSGISMIMVTFSFILILFSDLIFIILGEDYRSGISIFALLLISPVVVTVSETTCYGIYINKKTHLQFYCTLFSLVITIVLGFILIPKYGLFGAAITNAVGSIAFFLSRTYFGLKEYNSAEKLPRTLIAIGLLVVGGIINYYWVSSLVLKYGSILILLIITLLMYKDIIVQLKSLFVSLLNKYKDNRNKN